MDIKQVRKILGKTGEKMTEEEITKVTQDMTVLVNIILDKWEKMTPEERNKWKTKSK